MTLERIDTEAQGSPLMSFFCGRIRITKYPSPIQLPYPCKGMLGAGIKVKGKRMGAITKFHDQVQLDDKPHREAHHRCVHICFGLDDSWWYIWSALFPLVFSG